MTVAKRGEIWLVNLNPTLGREQQGLRPVMVVSDESFNRLGLTVICPITGGGTQSRFAGFAVSLMGSGLMTDGVVMCNQPRAVDLAARGGKRLEAAGDDVTTEVMLRVQTIFEISE